MSVETIINGKRMVLQSPMPFIEIALPPERDPFLAWDSDPLKRLEPITIRRQRHRLTRLVAEYELDGTSW